MIFAHQVNGPSQVMGEARQRLALAGMELHGALGSVAARWGVEVVFDAERSGRPRVFSPLQRVHRERVACTDPAAYSLPLARWACRRLQAGVVEQAIVGSMHATTGAQIVAQASRPPHRRRSWQTATSDARCVTQAAKMLWWYDRGEWRDERAEVVLCGDATPPLQVLVRRVPTPSRRRGQVAQRACEDKRAGTVTLLAALNVADGAMGGVSWRPMTRGSSGVRSAGGLGPIAGPAACP